MVRYRRNMYSELFKPLLDMAFALLFLILLSPLFIFIMLTIKISSRGSVFYKQTRVGQFQRRFTIIKFRTMKKEEVFDIDNPVIADDSQSLTKIGRLLRRMKLDELPQLLNILKGDMSFIGPRPFVEDYLNRYEEWEKMKFDVKPGLTGWAQVNGNGYLPLTSRSYYDIDYIRKIHIWTDLLIILKSVLVILFDEKRFIKQVTPEQIATLKYYPENVLFVSGSRVTAVKKGKK